MDATCRIVQSARGRTAWRGREIVRSWPPGAEAKPCGRWAAGRRGQDSRSPGRPRISV